MVFAISPGVIWGGKVCKKQKQNKKKNNKIFKCINVFVITHDVLQNRFVQSFTHIMWLMRVGDASTNWYSTIGAGGSFQSLKAGFHWRRSHSRSRNQKPSAIRYSENKTDGVGSRTLIPLMTPSLTISWKLDCRSLKRKRKNKPMLFVEWPPCCLSNCTRRTWGLALWLVYSSASASDSDNLVFTGS